MTRAACTSTTCPNTRATVRDHYVGVTWAREQITAGDPSDLWWDPIDPGPSIDVEVTDPAIIGTILGPDGSIIAIITDRPRIPFGFTR